MKNSVQTGSYLTLANSAAVTAGVPVTFTDAVFVPIKSGAANEAVAYATDGVFELDKNNTQAFTVGQVVYWDNTNKNVTSTATGNKQIGYAVRAQLLADTKCLVILKPA